MNDRRGPQKIPRLVHRIWLGGHKPLRKYAVHLASFDRGLWEYTPVFWDGRMCASFLRKFYPGYREAYRLLSSHAAKSDMMRYLILMKYGGLYADYDVVLTGGRELRGYLDGRHACVLLTEAMLDDKFRASTLRIRVRGGIPEDRIRIANFFMATRPGHPFMAAVIDEMGRRMETMCYRIREPYDVLYMTGPDVVSTVYHRGHRGVFRVSLKRSRAMVLHQGAGKTGGWKNAISGIQG